MSDFERGFQSGVRAVIDGGKEKIEELQAKLDAVQRIIEKQRYASKIKEPMTHREAEYFCLGHNDLRCELLNALEAPPTPTGQVNAGTALKEFNAVSDLTAGEEVTAAVAVADGWRVEAFKGGIRVHSPEKGGVFVDEVSAKESIADSVLLQLGKAIIASASQPALWDEPSELEKLKRALQDPVVVHRSILQGSVAKPTLEHIKHLYPELDVQDKETDEVVVQPLMSYDQHEKECGALIDERDQAVDWADKLAGAIGDYFGIDVGEHSNGNCPWQTAFENMPIPRPARSDQEIVDETNELASAIATAHNYEHEEGFKFYLSDHPRAKWFWKVACDGQVALTQTDPEDALANLEEDAVVAEDME